MGFLDHVVGASEWLIALPEWITQGRMAVLQCRRVRQADLVRHGFAHLVASADVRDALQDLRKAALAQAAGEERAEEHRQLAQEQLARELNKAPERHEALEAQVSAWVCASVVGFGNLPAGAEVDESGLVDACEDLEPARFCMELGDERPDGSPTVLWVGRVPDAVRMRLAAQLRGLNSVTGAIRPFRRVGGPSDGA